MDISAISLIDKGEFLLLKIEQILRDEEGRNVLNDSFESISIDTKFITVKQNGMYGIYRLSDYSRLLECICDKVTFYGDYIVASKYSKFALFDSDGKQILDWDWDKIVLYEKGILVTKNKIQGFYSYDGKVILECIWKRVEPYSQVLISYRGNGARRMTFDYKGNVVEDK